MIPVRLTLNGIYSYRIQQEIDFTALTGKHIFGIFGSVGSGKSTVLEAITFALYGETERLNKNDSRNYNMMNLKSDKLFIDFEFKAGDGNNDLFKFVVTGKRDKKDFSKIAKYTRSAYKMVRDEWIPLESASGESVLGLNYDNFRRTIILPQGKFQEFLQLGEAERTKMLQEIFNLGRFDLYRKVAAVEKKNDELFNTVTGQLREIGDINAEGVTQLREELKNNTATKKNIQKELTAVEKEITAHEEFKKLDGKITSLSAEMKRLDGLADSYNERERLLTEYEQCQKLFPDLFSRRDALSAAINTLDQKIRSDERSHKDKTAELERTESLLSALNPDYDNRQELQNKSDELLSIVKVFKQEADLKKTDATIAQKNEKLEALRRTIDELQMSITSSDEQAGTLRSERPDTSILHKINEWFRSMESIEENVTKQQKTADEVHNVLDSIRFKKDELLKEPILHAHGGVEQWAAPGADPGELVKSLKKNFKSTIKNLEEQKKIHLKDLALEHFAAEMEEGKPCPLCGAEHHPALFTATGVRDVVQKIDDEIEQIRMNDELLGDIAGKLSVVLNEERNIEKNADALELERATIEERLKTHRAAFLWPEYAEHTRTMVKDQLERAESLEKQISALENSRSKAQKDLNTQLQSEKQESSSIAVLEKDAENIRGSVRETLSRVRYYTVPALRPEAIESMVKDLTAEKGRIEKEFAELTLRKSSLSAETASLAGSLASDTKTYERQQSDLKEIDATVNERLIQAGDKTVDKVKSILNRRLETAKEKKEIGRFHEEISSCRSSLTALQREKGDREYDGVKHSAATTLRSGMTENLDKIAMEIGRLEEAIRDGDSKMRRKADLVKQRDMLENRRMNISTMKGLFTAVKFVKYASRVYLENIVAMANQRFKHLARQKLKLELDTDGSFLVRDFLNDGKVRSAKTLSGGQTFQASLSLALALSDSIQGLARTKENFFFMDEGFGTLDKESLTVVLDALRSLRSENRVVGIISHVEELQQEIDNNVRVTLDEEKGSLISYN